jgi:hypothetical protein
MNNDDPKVHVQMHFQVNLGNYNLLKIEFGCDDHKREGETTSQAFDRVFELVNDKISEKVQQVKSEVSAGKS